MDWGLYNAFRQKPDVDKRMQLEAQQIQYLSVLKNTFSEKNRERTKSEQAIQAYMQQMKEVEGLDRDRQNLLTKASSEEIKIIKGIANAGGDATKYLNTGGYSALTNYYKNIKNSDEMNKLVENKKVLTQHFKALSEGKLVIPHQMKDPDTGKQVFADVQKQLGWYEDEKIDKLTFVGAQAPVKIPENYFNKVRPDPNNPRFGRNVHMKELYDAYLIHGQNAALAASRAEQAELNTKPGFTTLMWKGDPLAEYAAKKRVSMGYGAFGGKGGGAGGQQDILGGIMAGKSDFAWENDLFMSSMMTGRGEIHNMDNLEPGEGGVYKQYKSLVQTTPKQYDELAAMAGVTKTKKGEKFITFRLDDKIQFMGMDKTFDVNQDMTGSYKVRSTSILQEAETNVAKNEEGVINQGDTERSMIALVQLESISDTKADKWRGKDKTSGKEWMIYDKGFIWDHVQQDFARVVQEDPDDSDKVRISIKVPIKYSPFLAASYNKQMQSPFLAPFGYEDDYSKYLNMTQTLEQDPLMLSKMAAAGIDPNEWINYDASKYIDYEEE